MEHIRLNDVHISTLYRRTIFMFICQTVNSDMFLETLFGTRSFTSPLRFGSVRFFEYAANSAAGERLRRESETSLAGRNRRHYSTE